MAKEIRKVSSILSLIDLLTACTRATSLTSLFLVLCVRINCFGDLNFEFLTLKSHSSTFLTEKKSAGIIFDIWSWITYRIWYFQVLISTLKVVFMVTGLCPECHSPDYTKESPTVWLWLKCSGLCPLGAKSCQRVYIYKETMIFQFSSIKIKNFKSYPLSVRKVEHKTFR